MRSAQHLNYLMVSNIFSLSLLKFINLIIISEARNCTLRKVKSCYHAEIVYVYYSYIVRIILIVTCAA